MNSSIYMKHYTSMSFVLVFAREFQGVMFKWRRFIQNCTNVDRAICFKLPILLLFLTEQRIYMRQALMVIFVGEFAAFCCNVLQWKSRHMLTLEQL